MKINKKLKNLLQPRSFDSKRKSWDKENGEIGSSKVIKFINRSKGLSFCSD